MIKLLAALSLFAAHRSYGKFIKRRKLIQVQAAELPGMIQPRLSNLLRGQFRGISEAKMLECLTRLGRDVEIVVRPIGRSQLTGHVSVVFVRQLEFESQNNLTPVPWSSVSYNASAAFFITNNSRIMD